MSTQINVRLTGRKFQDNNVHAELTSLVNQLNNHLTNISGSIVARKYGVIPLGLVNGINKVFTLSEAFNSDSLVVWLGPNKQVRTDYSIKNSTITFTNAPNATVVECDYDPSKA